MKALPRRPPTALGTSVNRPRSNDVAAANERSRVERGQLPERYAEDWFAPFLASAAPALMPGAKILDVGSGRRPTLEPARRPPAARYVGFDVSASELLVAPTGSYDEIFSGDIARPYRNLNTQFDLVLCWQVLEHVSPLASALTNMRHYLRPGGRMVAQVSGSFAAFALLGRIMPHRLRVTAMSVLLGADPDSKFPTRYDQCYASALGRLLGTWQSHEVVPRFRGANYFSFSRALELAYLSYENWAHDTQRANLATHYLIVATR